jgi:hypothetical protein
LAQLAQLAQLAKLAQMAQLAQLVQLVQLVQRSLEQIWFELDSRLCRQSQSAQVAHLHERGKTIKTDRRNPASANRRNSDVINCLHNLAENLAGNGRF